jgi:hypothetical protein
MGRSLVRGILNSARGISDKDMSPEAQAARRIGGFADLDGIEFVARIDVGTDANGDDKNEIRSAVTPDHKDYAQIMGTVPPAQPPLLQGQQSHNPQGTQPSQSSQAPSATGRPSWAQ